MNTIISALLIFSVQQASARITADVQRFCESLNPANNSEASDCMKMSQYCSFQMSGFLTEDCGATGARETEINGLYAQVSAMVAKSESYQANSESAIMNCQRVDDLRAKQKLQCGNTIQYCTTGHNPTPANGRPEVFYAPIKTKSGQVVNVTCDKFPDPVCEKFGRRDLNSRIPTVAATEKSVCDRAVAIQKSAVDNVKRLPANQDGSGPAYTADEIICHFKPDAEGCPKK